MNTNCKCGHMEGEHTALVRFCMHDGCECRNYEIIDAKPEEKP